MKQNYVLIHDIYRGGWCWEYLSSMLKAQGHRVWAPDLLGCGQRAHLCAPAECTLQKMVDDLATGITQRNLSKIVLVGHGFGGAVIGAVAHKIPRAIARLVFLDAHVLESGESVSSHLPAKVWTTLSETVSEGLMPVPPISTLIPESATRRHKWSLEQHMKPHPIQSYHSGCIFEGPPGNGLQAMYIVSTRPELPTLEFARQRAAQYGWTVAEISTHYDAMITAPDTLVVLMNAVPNILFTDQPPEYIQQFAELVHNPDGPARHAPCRIPQTERRAITLEQLQRVYGNVRRRVGDEKEVWMVSRPGAAGGWLEQQLVSPAEVNSTPTLTPTLTLTLP